MTKLSTRDVQEFIEQEKREAAGLDESGKKPGLSFDKEARFAGGVQPLKTVEGLAEKDDRRIYGKKL